MIIIYSKDTYITFNREGKYRVVQDGVCLAGTAGRKDAIVRNRQLPKWCIRAIEQGFWIEVQEFVPKGTTRQDFYLEVKGKTVKPDLFEESKVQGVQSDPNHTGQWSFYRGLNHLQRKVRGYKDFREPLSDWQGWEIVRHEFVKGLLKKDDKEFRAANPLPQGDRRYYEDFIKTEVKYTFYDDYAVKEEFDVVQPHETGYFYTYEYDEDENFRPYIKKHPVLNCWHVLWKSKGKENLSFLKKDVLTTRISTEFDGKCESNDGYRMDSCYSRYKVENCHIVLSDGTEHTVDLWHYLESW